jgi:hypothetical protein
MHKLTPRETVQVIAALRVWGRWSQMSATHPKDHPMCKDRFKDHLPLTLDEIETLIGRLDGSMPRGRRVWFPEKYL